MSYSMTYSLAGIKILICLYLGSWISYRKVFVIQTKLWTSPFQTIMSQLSSMFVARKMKQKLRRIFFETPSKVSGGCLAGFGKWSRRCPEGVWDVSNILDYLRQFSYTIFDKCLRQSYTTISHNLRQLFKTFLHNLYLTKLENIPFPREPS